MKLTDSRFIEELIICIRADEAVARSFTEHPEVWTGKEYVRQQEMRRAIARSVRVGEKSTDIIREQMVE